MVILEYPAEFGLLPSWLEESGHSVLANECALDLVGRGLAFNLVDEGEARRRIADGERVYTCSETALEWIVANSPGGSLAHAIETCKDKAALRRAIRESDPSFFFLECAAAELSKLDYATLPDRFVLKPNRGFCSVGVFVVENERDWEEALSAIGGNCATSAYPQDVVDDGTYVLEQFIEGTEYALDAYFDGAGAPHVLDVLRHDFASPNDTSDRLYVTTARIMTEMRPRFESWLARLNGTLGFADVCMHAEVRVQGDTIRPIEFNPLRFAGMGGTDISRYAYGFYTYEAYLEDRTPDWSQALTASAGDTFAMSFVMAEPDIPAGANFDLEAFCAPLNHVVDARQLDTAKTGAWAFVFARASEEEAPSLAHLMTADLHDYVR